MLLPPEVYSGIALLRERGFLLPPLEPPECCARCQRPTEPERRRFRLCFDCEHTHGLHLERAAAATYAAVGTPPWELLLDAKFQRVAGKPLAQRVAAIAAATFETVERVAPRVFEGGATVAVSIPSSRDLIHRCAAEAARRGWPTPDFDDRLIAEARPRQSELEGAEARRDAARDKYAFQGDLEGVDVVLLDDVYTSGYTMHDAARAVMEAGASSVLGVVYARRVFPDAMAVYREIRDG